MFDAIVHRRIGLDGLTFAPHLADIEALNQAALAGTADVTKISYYAYGHCRRDYALLDAGSALGRNCGPLLISARPITIDDVRRGGLRVAIPGVHTTANFLLGVAFPEVTDRTAIVFADIEQALLDGRFDAGVIIHENRFTYEAKGLRRIADLGELWERETGAPIPLGAIAIRRSLPDDVKQRINRLVRRSVEYAFAHRHASLPYVREHAQEMDESVMYKHIDLYVNDYSVDLGEEGRRAVTTLFDKALALQLVPPSSEPLFL